MDRLRRNVDEAWANVLVAVVLLVLAFLLRAPALYVSSLWLDDAWVALVHRLDDFDQIRRLGVASPGYLLLLRGVMATGLDVTLGARLPAIVSGILGPSAVFLLARRLRIRPVPSALAGILLAVSLEHVRQSARAKPYAWDALASMTIVWLAWRLLESPSPRRWLALFGASSVATMMSASIVPVAIAAIGACALATREWRWAVGYVGFVGAWWLGVVRRNVWPGLTEYWEGRYLEDPLSTAVRLLEGMSGFAGVLPVALLGAMVVVGLVLALRHDWRLALVLWGPLAVATVLALAGRVPLGTGRTDVYLYPVLAVAAAWTLDRLSPGIIIDTAVVGLAVLAAIPLPHVDYPRQDTRPLVDMVAEQMDEDDVLLAARGAKWATALYGPWPASLGQEHDGEITPIVTEPRVRWPATHQPVPRWTRGQLADIPPGSDIWVIASHDRRGHRKMMGEVLAAQGWERVLIVEGEGAVLERWERRDG